MSATLGVAMRHGPDMANFQSVAADLHKAGGALQIADAAGLADAVGRLLDDAQARQELAAAAATVAERNKNVVEHVAAAIAPYLEAMRAEEHTSELQSLMRISYAVFCLQKKKTH